MALPSQSTQYSPSGALVRVERMSLQLMAPQAELRVRDPDLLCHVGHVGPRVPPQASAASRGFGPGYRWACVAPGAVADEREASGVLDLGYYCCLRPPSRVVGPFRDAAGPTGVAP